VVSYFWTSTLVCLKNPSPMEVLLTGMAPIMFIETMESTIFIKNYRCLFFFDFVEI
jgi:hypothetical protein